MIIEDKKYIDFILQASDDFFYGVELDQKKSVKNGLLTDKKYPKPIFTDKKNIFMVGSMGVGKSVTLRNMFLLDYLKNFHDTLYFIIDPLKRATDLALFFNKKNVFHYINGSDKEMKYLFETKLFNILSHGKKIILFIDSYHSIPGYIEIKKWSIILGRLIKYPNVKLIFSAQRVDSYSLPKKYHEKFLRMAFETSSPCETEFLFNYKGIQRSQEKGIFITEDRKELTQKNFYLDDQFIKKMLNDIPDCDIDLNQLERELNKKRFLKNLN